MDCGQQSGPGKPDSLYRAPDVDGSMISILDGNEVRSHSRPTIKDMRRSVRNSTKAFSKRTLKTRATHPPWPPKLVLRESKQQIAEKEALGRPKSAEQILPDTIEAEGCPSLIKPRSYRVPLDRPSFHRIVRSFIQVERELYRAEQERGQLSSSESDQVHGSGRAAARRLSSLSESEGTTEHPNHHLDRADSVHLDQIASPETAAAVPSTGTVNTRSNITSDRLANSTLFPEVSHIEVAGRSSRDYADPPLHRVTSRETLQGSVISRDFAPSNLHPILQRNHVEAHISRGYANRDNAWKMGGERQLRASSESADDYPVHGTEGSVRNAPFMMESMHVDPSPRMSMHEVPRPRMLLHDDSHRQESRET
ncbi:hypothetical protein AAFC00_006654 [Neodothiora populina]|uniref:Uncharacterized protein n=1 Tax=Neodothiora populina TaxID=2781224 RepID=A0ABR3PAQ8_9PEZI